MTCDCRPCPDCDGEGEREYPSDRSPNAYYYMGACETCGGSGKDTGDCYEHDCVLVPIAGEVLQPQEVGE